MNRLHGIRGVGRFNIVNVSIYLLIIALAYGTWKYAPIYWQRENLIDIVQNAMLYGQRFGADTITQHIIETAERELKLKLKNDEVVVTRVGDTIHVEIYYTVKVSHPFGKEWVHTIHVKEKRTLLE